MPQNRALIAARNSLNQEAVRVPRENAPSTPSQTFLRHTQYSASTDKTCQSKIGFFVSGSRSLSKYSLLERLMHRRMYLYYSEKIIRSMSDEIHR